MNDFLKTINEKGATLSRWQTYTILLIIAGILFLLPAFSIITNYTEKKTLAEVTKDKVKTDKEMVTLLQDVNSNIKQLTITVMNNNLNNVTYDGACILYEKTFNKSKYKIIELVMYTITNNHIDDIQRRKVIKTVFTTSILNMYEDDYQKLSLFKYNEKRLNEPMDKINPTELVEEVLNILFNDSYNHVERRDDVMNYLTNQFNQYYQQSIKSI